MRFLWRVISLLILLAVTLPAKSQVVVSHSSHAISLISNNSLRSIFLMRLTEWQDGEHITVFVLPESNEVHVQFCKEVLGLFPYQLQQAWDRLVYSGTGQAPTVVESLQELKSKVSSTPGAIGYIAKDQVDETVNVILVE